MPAWISVTFASALATPARATSTVASACFFSARASLDHRPLLLEVRLDLGDMKLGHHLALLHAVADVDGDNQRASCVGFAVAAPRNSTSLDRPGGALRIMNAWNASPAPAPADPRAHRVVAHRQHPRRARRTRGADSSAISVSGSPAASRRARARHSARSRSPRLNQTSSPSSAQRVHHRERVVGEPPAALVDAVGQPERHEVGVGGDVAAVDLDVVAGVGDHHSVAPATSQQAAGELGAAGAAGEEDHRAAQPRRLHSGHGAIREVGPRDGFQNEPEVIPTADKVRLIDAARADRPAAHRGDELRARGRDPAAGRRRRGAGRRSTCPTACRVGAGPQRARADARWQQRERFDEVNVFLSASESHNRRNVNRSVEESLAGLERCSAARARRGCAARA